MGSNKPSQLRRSRRGFQKRRWLASLISLGAGVSITLANGVGLADGVANPLSGRAQAGRSGGNPFGGKLVRNNPFVVPSGTSDRFPTGGDSAAETSGPRVHGPVIQTSDLQHSQVRLKTIGTAVGLVPIGDVGLAAPPDVQVLEISSPNASRIRLNPLAGTDSV